MASLGISMQFFQKICYQHVRNVVLVVCTKSVKVWGKSGEMWGRKIILKCSFSPKVVWKVLLSFVALLKSSPYKVSLLICGRYITNNQEIYRIVWNTMVMQKPNQTFSKVSLISSSVTGILARPINKNLDHWEFTTLAVWFLKNIRGSNLLISDIKILRILRFC